MENARALQVAVTGGGTITVSRPGTYRLADTVLLDSDTTLLFGNGVKIKKVNEIGPFTHVLLNRGALTKTWDRNIVVDGLDLIVNRIDVRNWKVFGLHGQIAFHYAKDVTIHRFRCDDLGPAQYGIHVCTFEDLLVDDVIVHGHKDGVHLGRGKRFTIRNGRFGTGDDAVALNAHDYDVGNPELGWIEDGVIENCHDLRRNGEVGYFARILAGAWIDWKPGMEVQKSDTVVSEGRLYRVSAPPDDRVYVSKTRPTHATGKETLDGIDWVMVQTDVTYTAGVRNVIFRDIFLEKPRIGLSVHFDIGKYSRSYYPGAPVPRQEQITFENIRVLHDGGQDFLSVGTPMDRVTLNQCVFRNNAFKFHGNRAMEDYGTTRLSLMGCVWQATGDFKTVVNEVPGKRVVFQTIASTVMDDRARALVSAGPGNIETRSDLPGLS